MGNAVVIRGEAVLPGQRVDLRSVAVADDRVVAGVLHHDLDDVLIRGNGGVV
jgi:hypothetical protein